MYLKEISASGFKSFADKLTINLDGKTTCIVGPNGSGKSNIVDAVRWVLGEQSVKSLRGDNGMTDVIFSGSKSRNSLNVASVSLTFDNLFVVHDIKVIEGHNGLFIAMPSRKVGEGNFRDIAHPINAEMRQVLEDAVLKAYHEALAQLEVAAE